MLLDLDFLNEKQMSTFKKKKKKKIVIISLFKSECLILIFLLSFCIDWTFLFL